jgi:hypothetical protein
MPRLVPPVAAAAISVEEVDMDGRPVVIVPEPFSYTLRRVSPTVFPAAEPVANRLFVDCVKTGLLIAFGAPPIYCIIGHAFAPDAGKP